MYKCSNKECQEKKQYVLSNSIAKSDDYKCTSCDSELIEVDKPVVSEAPAVHFKGYGFPSNDMKRKT